MVVEPLNDVMSYFHFVFIAYIVLFIIVLVNFYKALHIKKLSENKYKRSFAEKVDLFIDVLCGIAMAAGIMFQGVLADNNASGHEGWSNWLLAIAIVSLIIFILNVIVVFKENGKS
ncbi:phosphatidylglycerophosphate synthase [Clostridium punense]|uniref:Phosphatidylglycerophosphate synthase n=1 Tax=Clostridium punense TaxID=1054297 RepID=A0ABS4K3V2_9CLOT|nr:MULTISPECIES: hypothetical protein [Clostridium]EQB85849.1 hypothetical protein M918_17320 [Clostridium sp. BL8]MBP2022467.1 phosphatidylglycerophosphate synthase [Clostridium punense]